ncbi:MAG: hypothetical protein JXQ71_09450 [Verrucomicrobia bacterium]|nr:hypothetical protein [Verrucomicrobiota bacterium]
MALTGSVLAAPGGPAPAGAPASFSELFDQGTRSYLAAGYKQAAELFRQAAALQPASGVFHNLGNAEYMAGRVGPAILAWERAHWLAPYFDNTRANLRFARKKAQLDEPGLAWYEICSTWLPPNAWPWIAGVSLWLAVGMVMLPGIFHWPKSDWHQGLAAAGFAVFLLTLPALGGVISRSELGVVLEKETRLRLTPTQDAQTLTRLPAGEIGRVERRRGHYYYVRLASDAAGWVDAARFSLICRE